MLLIIATIALVGALAEGGEWKKVTEEMEVDADLYQNQIQIKTTSLPGSNTRISMFFFGEGGYGLAGGLVIQFWDPMHYWIHFCHGEYKPFPVVPQTDVVSIWSVYRVGKMLKVKCNGVLVLDFDTSQCGTDHYWTDEIKVVAFSYDDASEEYQITPQYGEWKKVTEEIEVDADLYENQLQIKTTSVPGSNTGISMYFYGEGGYGLAGGLSIQFWDPMQYWISFCHGEHRPFPVVPQTDEVSIWSIYRVANMLKVECNGVLVLDFDTSQCGTDYYWGEETKVVAFKYDDASEEYRIVPQ